MPQAADWWRVFISVYLSPLLLLSPWIGKERGRTERKEEYGREESADLRNGQWEEENLAHCGGSIRYPTSSNLRPALGKSLVSPPPQLQISNIVQRGQQPSPTCFISETVFNGISSQAESNSRRTSQRQLEGYCGETGCWLRWVAFDLIQQSSFSALVFL